MNEEEAGLELVKLTIELLENEGAQVPRYIKAPVQLMNWINAPLSENRDK